MKDAHLHLTDSRINAKETIAKSKVQGIDGFISCTAKNSEWASLKSLVNIYPEVKGFFGIHPWYIDSFSNKLTSDLESLLKLYPNIGVGEIGLDKLKPDYDKQCFVFTTQLELAIKYNRPVVIHAVKSHQEILAILKHYKKDLPAIMLHGFLGPINYIHPFAELGCYFSISPLILKKVPKYINELISAIPSECLLFESDAPNCLKTSADLPIFVNKISDITSISYEQLENITGSNFESFLS